MWVTTFLVETPPCYAEGAVYGIGLSFSLDRMPGLGLVINSKAPVRNNN